MCQEDEEGVIIGGYMRQGGKYSREREIGCVRVKDLCEYEDEKYEYLRSKCFSTSKSIFSST